MHCLDMAATLAAALVPAAELISSDAASSGPPGASPAIAWLYAAFIALVILFLALDLGVFHREAHVVAPREAALWTSIWAGCALIFTVVVYLAYDAHWLGLGLNVPLLGEPGHTTTVDGLEAAEQFLTGYIVEWSLSMDNVFVIAVIFTSLSVPAIYHHRVLFWGILGALLMRGLMIALGAALIGRFGWITYLFGGFLILTAGKMAFTGHESVHPDRHILVRLCRRICPISADYDGPRFFTHLTAPDGRRYLAATPLLLALLIVEFTDLIFAVDSVPAIYAITADPFLVFTSNVFAILGLRSLYFLLAGMIGKFRFLKPALVFILLFVGVKMLLIHTPFKISALTALLVILSTLTAAVAASLLIPASPVPAGKGPE
jgi:tellurite resistance protein TerC